MSGSKIAKSIIITAQASENHNVIKLRSIIRWLKSGHDVRVSITGKADRHTAMELIKERIEKDVKTAAKIQQKIVKPESIKFVLKPTEEAANLLLPDHKIDADQELESLVKEKDILSDEFEKELEVSIEKHKKH